MITNKELISINQDILICIICLSQHGVLIIFHRYEFLRENNACRFLGSLAIADILGGVAAFLETVWNATELSSTFLSNLLCRLMLLFYSLSALGNFYSYLLMTIDRLVYVERPLRYISLVTQKRALLGVIIVWVVNIVQSTSKIKWNLYVVPEYSCNWLNDKLTHRPGVYFSLFELYVVTFFVLAPIYGKIAYTTWMLIKTEPHISNLSPHGQIEQKKKIKQRKMTKTIGITFGIYLICFFFPFIYIGITSQSYNIPYPFGILLLNKTAIFVYRLTLVLNAFIYATTNKMMKTAYHKMFCKHNQIVF